MGDLFETIVLDIVSSTLEQGAKNNMTYRALKQNFKSPAHASMEVKKANYSHSDAFKAADNLFKKFFDITKAEHKETYDIIIAAGQSAAASLLSTITAKMPASPDQVDVTLDAVGGWAAYGDGFLGVEVDGISILEHILEMKMYQDISKEVTYYNARDTRLFGDRYSFWNFLADSDVPSDGVSRSSLVSPTDFWNLGHGGMWRRETRRKDGSLDVKTGDLWAVHVREEALPVYLDLLSQKYGSPYALYNHIKSKAGYSPGPKILVRGMKKTKGTDKNPGKTSLVFSMEAMLEAMADKTGAGMELNTKPGSTALYFEAVMRATSEKLAFFKIGMSSESFKFFSTAREQGYTKAGYPSTMSSHAGRVPWVGLDVGMPAAYFQYAMQKNIGI